LAAPVRAAFVPRESVYSRTAGIPGEAQMEGVKVLAVLASIYYPGDGIVAKNNYQTSSGERYDQSAHKCAALQWPLGTMLHLVHGRNNIDVTINDHGPYHRGRALDCTPAVDKALHLGGLGSVRVEPYPPLPKVRPAEAQVATWSETDSTNATVTPPAVETLHSGGLGSVRVEPYPPLPKVRPAEAQVANWSGTEPMDATAKPPAVETLHSGGLGSVRVDPYPPLPKARPTEAQLANWSGTEPMDATAKPPVGHASDRSLRPLPSSDGPQHFSQPKRVGTQVRTHTPSVALGNSSQGDASGPFISPPW